VLPNVLATALRALAEVSRSAEIGLQSLKDNPTFLRSDADGGADAVVSSAEATTLDVGLHDPAAATT
jgi:hypothetical protein